MSDIFGTGWNYPLTIDSKGGILMTSDASRVMESIEKILKTPKGTCPLDPLYGMSPKLFSVVNNVSELTQDLRAALNYAERRVDYIHVQLAEHDIDENTITLRISFKPSGSITEYTRIFPFYQAI